MCYCKTHKRNNLCKIFNCVILYASKKFCRSSSVEDKADSNDALFHTAKYLLICLQNRKHVFRRKLRTRNSGGAQFETRSR
jgi:hypothetical protein